MSYVVYTIRGTCTLTPNHLLSYKRLHLKDAITTKSIMVMNFLLRYVESTCDKVWKQKWIQDEYLVCYTFKPDIANIWHA